MKPTRLIVLLMFSSFWQLAYCDIIPDNTHYVEKCVKITNIADFNNLSLLGYVNNIMGDDYNYIISSSECLSIGYKFNSLEVYGISSGYLEGKDINNINPPNDIHALKTNIDIEPYEGYYPDSDPTNKIEEYYKIVGFTDTSVVIFKWKEVIGYNDGSDDLIKTYEYSGDISSLYQNITGINENKDSDINISLFPNPAEEYINAAINNSYFGSVEIKFYSSTGSLLSSTVIIKNSMELSTLIPFKNNSPGVYFISFKLEDAIVTKRFIIK